MCTLILLRRPDHAWPLILGANRDEMLDRAWLPPERHWPDRPDVVGGLDEIGGGSWLAMNDTGVVAGILNWAGSLGPMPGKRSRGELVLDALDYPDAAEAAGALGQLDPDAYRPFNLVIADNRDAFWLANRAGKGIAVEALSNDVSMITEGEINDMAAPRIKRYLPQFRQAPPPDPDLESWEAWQELLTDRSRSPGLDRPDSLNFRLETGFGTLSHSLIALAEPGRQQPRRWLFAMTKAEVGSTTWTEVPF